MKILASGNPPAMATGKSKGVAVISKNIIKNKKLANDIQFKFLVLGLAFLCLLTPTRTLAQTQNAPILLVELFTSSGCPACPPADRNFNQLIENPNIIGLSCHVTYFDRGHRRDHLSKPFCDARQNIYKLALRTGGIFTPMTVVNGQRYTTGKKISDTKSLINNAQNSAYQSVGFHQNGQYLDISLPRMPVGSGADIWLVEVKKRDGRFRNAVTNITKLLRWDGSPLNMAFPVSAPNANTGYALVIQSYKGGVITAAKTNF